MTKLLRLFDLRVIDKDRDETKFMHIYTYFLADFIIPVWKRIDMLIEHSQMAYFFFYLNILHLCSSSLGAASLTSLND